jgi:hypothetical protein
MMRDHRMWQRNLFDDDTSHLPPLEEEVKQMVTQLLVQWIQALAKAIEAEVSDEQDQR